MLINSIVGFSKNQYEKKHSAGHCSHCTKKCSHDCKLCLEQVHYHKENGKSDYDCINMIHYYVCCYTFKYASEILYLMKKSNLMKQLDEYNIMSFGCGASPDLMALEKYNEYYNKPINYIGVDTNRLWSDIHNEIKKYMYDKNAYADFTYNDAFYVVENNTCTNINVIVMQYFISHLYNTHQINELDIFFDNLIDNVILKNNRREPVIIMINDVNSINCGRDCFINLFNKLNERNIHCTIRKSYFEYDGINQHQFYGEQNSTDRLLFDVPDEFSDYPVWRRCTSSQLLIEIEWGKK